MGLQLHARELLKYRIIVTSVKLSVEFYWRLDCWPTLDRLTIDCLRNAPTLLKVFV